MASWYCPTLLLSYESIYSKQSIVVNPFILAFTWYNFTILLYHWCALVYFRSVDFKVQWLGLNTLGQLKHICNCSHVFFWSHAMRTIPISIFHVKCGSLLIHLPQEIFHKIAMIIILKTSYPCFISLSVSFLFKKHFTKILCQYEPSIVSWWQH